jgi:hypothetical protein
MAVIHQPRSSIYAMFDQLMILSEGSLMFHGEASKAIDYFSSLSRFESEFSCPPNFNPSDFFLDLMSPDHRSISVSLCHLLLTVLSRSPELAKYSIERIEYLRVQNHRSQSEHPSPVPPASDASPLWLTEQKDEQRSAVPLLSLCQKNLESYLLLVWRCFTESRRDVATQRIRLLIALFFCLVVGGLYSNGSDGQSSIYNRAGFFFFISINQGYTAVNCAVNVLVKEKVIVHRSALPLSLSPDLGAPLSHHLTSPPFLRREVEGNAYTFLTYFLAKFTSEIPFTLLPTLCFSLIIYWIVDLDPSAANYGMFILILLVEVISALSLGLVISAFAPSVEAAMAISAPLLTCLILFSGFYMLVPSVPLLTSSLITPPPLSSQQH